MKTNYQFKQQIIAALILLLLTSLFISRSLLSIITVLFFVSTIIFYYKELHSNVLKKKKHSIVICLLFFIALGTFFFSEYKTEWWNRTLVKLPMVLLVISFLALQLNEIAVFLINRLFIILVVGGTLYSVGIFYLNSEELLKNYSVAKVLPTILDNDHIRFSWCVVIAIILSFYQHNEVNSKNLKAINVIICVWLIIFLHILACKTGLIMLYTSLLIFSINQYIKYKKFIFLIPILLVFFLPLISYFTLPTFKKRVNYIFYDYSFYSKGIAREGLSDGVRIISNKAGVNIISKNIVAGVGYGDVKYETNKWYNENANSLKEYEKILPSSQFVIVTMAGGIIGIGLFLYSLILPLYKINYRKDVYFLMFFISSVLTFIFEIHLESQYGVFIFTFFTLWFMFLSEQTKIIKKIDDAEY